MQCFCFSRGLRREVVGELLQRLVGSWEKSFLVWLSSNPSTLPFPSLPWEFLPWFPKLLNWLGRSCRESTSLADVAFPSKPLLSPFLPCQQVIYRGRGGNGRECTLGSCWLSHFLIAFTFGSIFSYQGQMMQALSQPQVTTLHLSLRFYL